MQENMILQQRRICFWKVADPMTTDLFHAFTIFVVQSVFRVDGIGSDLVSVEHVRNI